jgi:hypothetical protein
MRLVGGGVDCGRLVKALPVLNIWKFWRTLIVVLAPIVLSPLLIKLEGLYFIIIVKTNFIVVVNIIIFIDAIFIFCLILINC